MVALLAQAVMGTLSDRSHHSWGRRRPFIFFGTIADLIVLVGLGFVAGLDGMIGFWALFIIAFLLQISSNTAQAGQQGLIPDMIPSSRQGLFSGFKALFEVPIPLIIVSFTIGKLLGQGDFWMGIFLTIAILLVTMLLTMTLPEKRNQIFFESFQWSPYLRLFFMAAIFTTIIIIAGKFIQVIGSSSLLHNLPQDGLVYLFIPLGIFGMMAAVAAGVWSSIRIGLGKQASIDNSSFTWWVINRLAFFVGITNLGTFAIYFLQTRLNYPGETAIIPGANLMLVIGLSVLVSVLPAGWLADRFGKKAVVMAAGIIASVGTWVVVLASGLASIYVGGAIIGAATGIFFASNWALGTSLVPKSEAGRYLGISNLAGAGAGAIGAYLGGPIADFFTINTPDTPGLGYVVLFSIYGIFFLFSSLALVKVVEAPSRIFVE
jgi:MFS family permease